MTYTKAKRYFRPGVTQIWWVETISDYTSPTGTELAAGTELTDDVASVDGWSVESDAIEVPDFASSFTKTIPGATKASDSSITMYASSDSNDIRTLLSRGDSGYVVWMDGGGYDSSVTTKVMDVYPVTVSSLAMQRSVSDPAEIKINFTITDVPAEAVTIPSAV